MLTPRIQKFSRPNAGDQITRMAKIERMTELPQGKKGGGGESNLTNFPPGGERPAGTMWKVCDRLIPGAVVRVNRITPNPEHKENTKRYKGQYRECDKSDKSQKSGPGGASVFLRKRGDLGIIYNRRN